MNIKKITEGDIIKNYKDMCSILEEEVKAGNSKTAQLKEWERYFDFSRKGQKFIIEKIYEIPKPKALKENTIYVKNIELLLMYELSKKAGYCCNYTKTNLFKLLGMINDNYLENRMIVVSEDLKEFNKWEIRHFYGRTNQKLSDILFSALNSMKRRCLIEYKERIIIAETIKDGIIYREASVYETKCILQAKKKVLADMGYTKIPFLKFNEFYGKINKYLNKLYNWNYVYKEYQIIYNKKFMRKDISVAKKEIKEELYKKEFKLNCDIISAVNKQADKLFEKNHDEFLNEWLESDYSGSEPFKFENGKFFYPNNYIEVQNELAEFLLRI